MRKQDQSGLIYNEWKGLSLSECSCDQKESWGALSTEWYCLWPCAHVLQLPPAILSHSVTTSLSHCGPRNSPRKIWSVLPLWVLKLYFLWHPGAEWRGPGSIGWNKAGHLENPQFFIFPASPDSPLLFTMFVCMCVQMYIIFVCTCLVFMGASFDIFSSLLCCQRYLPL